MQRTFKKNQPIKEDWGSPDPNHQGGQFKELAGGKAFFHRHCQTSMIKVISYFRDNEGNIKKIGLKAWVCPVCHDREIPPPDFI